MRPTLRPVSQSRRLQERPDELGYDGRPGPLRDADVERHTAAHLGLEAALRQHGLAVEVLLEHVVRGHVGAVDQLGDLQSGDFEHVLGLAQRASRDVGHGDHLLAEGVDRDVDRAPGLDLDAALGQLVEDDAALVGRHEERVVDVDLQVAFLRLGKGRLEGHAGKVGHGAAGAVARADLHDEVCRDGQYEDDRRDHRQVEEQRPALLVVCGILHGSGVISVLSGRGRRQCPGR